MHSLSHYQSAIYDAHFNGNNSGAIKLIVPSGLANDQRLNIYRNNTFITLTETLSTTFSVINKLVGDDFFKFMAREFINESPPVQGPLFEYGENFADFLNHFKPVATLPYIADIAHLEWAMNFCYHARDAAALKAQNLTRYSDNEIGHLRLEIHPTCRIVTSNFPIYQIWQGNQPDGNLDDIDLNNGADILVIRPEQTVNINVINHGYVCFLKSLILGQNIEEAFTVASALHPQLDPARTITDLMSMGAFTAIKIEQQ